MKPDWQNKSFAKGGTATGPSTMHAKLKVGMSSLHSKIGMANSNMPQAPKPAVRKFADGGVVRTRSDDEIGDTDPRTGKVDPGSYDRRMAEGAKNMERLRSVGESISSFFAKGDKSSTAARENESTMTPDDLASTYYTTGKKTDTAETKSEMTAEPSYKTNVLKTVTAPKEVKAEAAPSPAPAQVVEASKPKPKVQKAKVSKADSTPDAETSSSRSMSTNTAPTVSRTPNTAARMSPVGNSQKDVDFMAQQKNRQRQSDRDSTTDTGDETKRLFNRTSKFVPGFGRVSNTGMIGGGKTMGQSIEDAGVKIDKAMTDAGTRYLQSKMDRGETLTTMEKAQAKRAGII
jgi:hypothetical protein